MSRYTMLRSAFVRPTCLPSLQSAVCIRAQSTYAKAQLKCDDSQQAGEATSSVSPTASSRWFSELQARILRLKDAPKSPRCVEDADRLLQQTNTNWMGLLAGSQGFLTEPRWRGLDNHQVFWGDMDSMDEELSKLTYKQTGHINNVMYNRYVESARVQFIRHHGLDATAEERKQWEDLVTPRSLGLILKTMTTEFKFPMKYPDRVYVLYRLTGPPTPDSTSLRMESWILSDQHRRIAAKVIDETAIYDYTVGKVSVLKPFMVEKLKRTFAMQEEARGKYAEEARKAIEAVEELESRHG
ncbi:hypothetical protein QIS74_09260 [Colletotrichum tabaci]|uniref:Thioesterase thiol ester dehydrase-isomerase n=1 Tax=Colletotrichum tabaci TaxID=1209068 RepID=A0AAV9T3N1_9PEZI